MTDRIATLTVVLDQEYRTDDVEHIKNAINMIKGVQEVTNGEVCDGNHYMNKVVIGQTIRKAVNRAIDECE